MSPRTVPISNHQISAAPERRFIGKRTRLSLPVLRPDMMVRKYWRIKRIKDSVRRYICGKSCAFCFYGTSWRQFERALGIAVECASRFNVLGLDFGFPCPSLPSLPSLEGRWSGTPLLWERQNFGSYGMTNRCQCFILPRHVCSRPIHVSGWSMVYPDKIRTKNFDLVVRGGGGGKNSR